MIGLPVMATLWHAVPMLPQASGFTAVADSMRATPSKPETVAFIRLMKDGSTKMNSSLIFLLSISSVSAVASSFPCEDPLLPPPARTAVRTCTIAEAPTIFEAARKNCVNLVEAYARRGDDLNVTTWTQEASDLTPLALTIIQGAVESAKVLLDYGASQAIAPCFVTSARECRKSLLLIATEHQDLALIDLLMKHLSASALPNGYDPKAFEAAKFVGPLVEALLTKADRQPQLLFQGLAKTGSCATMASFTADGMIDDNSDATLEVAIALPRRTMHRPAVLLG